MKKLLMLLILAIFLVFPACNDSGGGGNPNGGGGDDDDDYGVQVTSTGSFNTPANITINKINGDDYLLDLDLSVLTEVAECFSSFSVEDTSSYTYEDFMDIMETLMTCMNSAGVGSSGSFYLGINITNNTGAPFEFIIPAGTLFEPDSSDDQPMMVISDVTITLATGEGIYGIPVFCLAAHKSAPGSGEYDISGLVTNSCWSQIEDILGTKDIPSFTFGHISSIQGALWSCTNGKLTQTELDYLITNLPDK